MTAGPGNPRFSHAGSEVELRYIGFRQSQNIRVYNFDCSSDGKSFMRLAVSADLTLFLKYRVGIQEGPTLCAQKLSADLEAHRPGEHELTNEDLLAFAAERSAAEARKAESRKPGPKRRRPEPGQQVSPHWR